MLGKALGLSGKLFFRLLDTHNDKNKDILLIFRSISHFLFFAILDASVGFHGIDNASESDDICSLPEAHTVFCGRLEYLFRGISHLLFELLANLFGFPIIIRIVLHLLEVADRYAPGICQYIGNDRDCFLEEYLIRLGDSRSIRQLYDELRLDVVHIFQGDLVLERSRDKDVACLDEQLLIAHLFSERCILKPVLRSFEAKNRTYVEPIRVVNSCFGIGYADEDGSGILQELCHSKAGVSRPLDNDFFVSQVRPLARKVLFQYKEPALRGCFSPSERSATRERLASKSTGRILSDQTRILVHHPCHDLGSGIHIRSRYVLRWTQVFIEGTDIPARKSFELSFGELFRVHHHSSLSTTERQIERGAFDAHPHRKGLHFVFADIGVESYSSFVGATGIGML